VTEQISTLVPSPAALGEYIQENALKGYRLQGGYPIVYGWQYEVIMNLVTAEEAAPKKQGRPPKAA
jgi:hypothetical protein